MGCFTGESVQQEPTRAHACGECKAQHHHQSLRSILSSKDGPDPSSPSSATASSADYVKRVVESKLGLVTKKTLRARARLLSTATVSLARAQQRAAMACTSSSSVSSPFIVNNCTLLSAVAQKRQLALFQYFVQGRQMSQEQALFPLPLPPGYCDKAQPPNDNSSRSSSKASTPSSSSAHSAANSASDISFAPSSPLSSSTLSVKSSAPSLFSTSSTSTTSSLPRSHSTCDHLQCDGPAASDPASKVARCNSLSLREAQFCSEAAAAPPPRPPVRLPTPATLSASGNALRRPAAEELGQNPAAAATAAPATRCMHSDPPHHGLNQHHELSPRDNHIATSTDSHLREYSLEEVAGAWDESGPRGAYMGVTVARVAVSLSQRKWKANVQALARLEHPNLCKIVGFAYEKVKLNGPILMETCNAIRGMGIIVYETCARGSLHSVLKDSSNDHQTTLDWSRRMEIATGAAEGLAFLHEGTSNQIYYGNFSASCIQIDGSFNAKLVGFGVPRQTDDSVGMATDAQADVHAFGLVLLELFAGTTPKDGLSQNLAGGDANLVADLVARCLSSQPSLRPSMRHVVRSLRSTQPPPLATLKKKKRLSLS